MELKVLWGFGMAAATFGLVMGGIIGGPLAKFLINRYKLSNEKSYKTK